MDQREPNAQELRAIILAHKPKLKPVEVLGQKAYMRQDLTVGEANDYYQAARKRKIKLAEAAGIELTLDDPQTLQSELDAIADPYAMASRIAHRLCDSAGLRIFDPADQSDLDFINGLGNEFLQAADTGEESAEKN